jgi:hypothetical protein
MTARRPSRGPFALSRVRVINVGGVRIPLLPDWSQP